MTTRDLCVDGLGNPRCWRCGAQGFGKVRSLEDRVLHRRESLRHPSELECQRCGATSRLGEARNFPGPEDSTYADEWAAAPQGAHRPFFDPAAPPDDEAAAAAQANWKLQYDILVAATQPF